MDLAFWLLLSWMVVLVCLAKGIRTSGKVSNSFKCPFSLCPVSLLISMSNFHFEGGILHCHLPLPDPTHPIDNVSHLAWSWQWHSLSICTQCRNMAQACRLSGVEIVPFFSGQNTSFGLDQSATKVWRKAAGQVFFSLGISWGGIVMFGSYNRSIMVVETLNFS